MIKPALIVERVQRAVEGARGPKWRPSSYITIPSMEEDEDAKWQDPNYARTKSLIDVASGSVIVLLLCFLFFLGSDSQLQSTTSTGEMSLAMKATASDMVNAPEYRMFQLLGDYDPEPIRALCEHKKFQPGLYFQCDESDGGIGNIRNAILLCTRYAIETGAQLLTPHIHLRSTADLAELYGNMINMTYLFDYELYKRRVEESCPGMKIYESVADIPESNPVVYPSELYDPVDLHPHGGMINSHILDHRVETRQWIYSNLGIHPSKETPIVVRLKRALFGWHYGQDPYAIWYEWGKLLDFQPITYKLAAEILTILAKTNHPDLHDPVIMNHGYRFVGQHLRTEADSSVEMKMFGFEPQMEAAIDTCRLQNITQLYIASGDAGEAAKAAQRAAEHGITVHTKYSIMENYPALQKAIVEMTFDQQALIDYLILQKCTQFVGVDSSSFSSNLVVTRHATLKGETPWQGFQDDLSYLMGGRYEWLRDGIWA